MYEWRIHKLSDGHQSDALFPPLAFISSQLAFSAGRPYANAQHSASQNLNADQVPWERLQFLYNLQFMMGSRDGRGNTEKNTP